MKKFILGIDTSCYTTSIALLDSAGCLLADSRRLLQVKLGQRGLAQSAMVFQHMRYLPEVLKLAWESVDQGEIVGIGVTKCPRRIENSYMPAFLSGLGYAKTLSTVLKIPLYEISHQENHILAGIWSAGGPTSKEFLALHISGGTTDLLRVVVGSIMVITQIGGSIDINAGQFVDRIGVALGLPFPAGSALEKLACQASGQGVSLPVAVNGLKVSFAGPASQATRFIDKGMCGAEIAASVQKCIADSLVKMLVCAADSTGIDNLLVVGGVSCNKYIRQSIIDQLKNNFSAIYIPQAQYSCDNAVGAAYYAYQKIHLNEITCI